MEIVDRTIALLIDADNISQRYLELLLEELNKLGIITYKRVYGDFTSELKRGWRELLLKYGMIPIQQYSYTSGKNSSDSTMIIDAMDILYKNKVDCICIATSDSDFTRLASRFKEENYVVIGAGEKKTPEAFRAVCDRFLFMDVLLSEQRRQLEQKRVSNKNGDEQSPVLNLASLIRVMKEMVSQCADADGWAFFSAVMNLLYAKHNDFNPKNYGDDEKPINFFRKLEGMPFEFRKDRAVMIRLRQGAVKQVSPEAKKAANRSNGFRSEEIAPYVEESQISAEAACIRDDIPPVRGADAGRDVQFIQKTAPLVPEAEPLPFDMSLKDFNAKPFFRPFVASDSYNEQAQRADTAEPAPQSASGTADSAAIETDKKSAARSDKPRRGRPPRSKEKDDKQHLASAEPKDNPQAVREDKPEKEPVDKQAANSDAVDTAKADGKPAKKDSMGKMQASFHRGKRQKNGEK